MSIPINTDNSVQLSYSSFPFIVADIDNYATSNYVSNISNVLINNINTKQPTLTAATTLLGVGSSISALDYNKITVNKPSFFPADWNSTISNKPTYFQTDWNTTITNKPSTFPVDTTVYYNKTEVNNLLNAKQASISTYSITGATGGSFGFTTGTLTLGMPTNYTASMSLSNLITPTSFIYQGTELLTTLNTKQASISTYTITGAIGGSFGFTTGTLTLGMPTNYTANMSLSNLITPTSFIYKGTELSTTLATKQNNLTFSSPLVNTTNTITFNESSITTLTNFYNKTEANNLLNAKQASISTYTITGATGGSFGFSTGTLTLGMPTNYTASMSLSNLITPTSFIYQGTELSTTLATKQNNLTFSSPLVNTTNTITFNESAITTLTNFYNKTDANARYLQLAGGTMSAGANIITTGNIRAGSLTAGETTYQLLIGPPTATTSSSIQTILQGTGYNQNLTLQSLGGNVGIGTTNPGYKLHIRGSNPTILRVETANNLANEVSGIEFGIPAFTSAKSAKIISTTAAGDVNNLEFYTSSGTSSTVKMSISGAGEITAQVLRLTTLASGNNPLFIRSANTSANNCIIFQNDLNRSAYVGYGGSAFPGGGNYVNNFFIESANGAIVLNTQGRTSTSTPNLLIRTDGHIETSGYIIAGTNGTTSQGLRIGGWDTGNTLYQDSTTVGANMGFTLRNANSFNFTSYSTAGVYTTMLTINTTGIKIPLADYTFGIRDWYLYQGLAAGTISNSFIFWHSAVGFNSKWWFNGTQTSTNSEISDERIKKEIKEIETPLNKIMTLKPKEYYLCDDKDYNKKFGIIAQDIEQIFPEFIHTENNYIANIFSYAKYADKIITIDKDISNLINIDDELKLILDNNDKTNLEIAIDDTPYNNRYKRRFVKVVEIIDNHSFKIDIELEDLFENSSNTNNIFIYGKKVDNFKRLDYESLYCLNIAATQELYKIIQQLQERISILESRQN